MNTQSVFQSFVRVWISTKRQWWMCVFIFCLDGQLIGNVHDSIPKVTGRFFASLEFGGHNYQSYLMYVELAPSVNIGFRVSFSSQKLHLVFQTGYGTFVERHIRQQPLTRYWSWCQFLPIEVSLQIGDQYNFLEIGGAYVHAWGEHWIYYSGSQGSQSILKLKNGCQYILRIGYTRIFDNNFFLRFAYTPHFYDSELKTYDGKRIDRGPWIPIGITLGLML